MKLPTIRNVDFYLSPFDLIYIGWHRVHGMNRRELVIELALLGFHLEVWL